MASNAETKLYAAVGVLVVLGGALFLTNKKQKEQEATYTLSGQAATLPKIAITDDDVKAIDKIVLTKAPGEDAGAGTEVELVKKGEDWTLSKPVAASAQTANVKSLLDNLKSLKVSELIDSGKTSYEKFKVGDNQGLHAVFSKGGTVVLDARFGENGGRGQMTRLAGKDGVYAVKGYSSYLYDREVKGWRDTTVFKFEDTNATNVSIENEHGSFAFAKDKDTWSAKYKEPKGGAWKPLEKFDESKVKDMLRAYKGLNADSFADPAKTPADLGLEKPSATVLITLNDGAKREVKVGATAEGSSRWVQATGVKELVSISSWAADWATAEPKKFQKADEKKAEKDDKGGGMKIAGPGAGMVPPGGMPPGHGGTPPGHP
jgi:hypothetical protein